MAKSSLLGSLSPFSKGLVVRSPVPKREKYNDYKQELRIDFFWSCCYCTMTEIEAGSIRFVIDHWVPQSVDVSLINDYSNLYWTCELCNVAKSDIYPPDKARADGIRFLRAEEDIYTQHIQCDGFRLNALTKTGDFTIDYCDLNRRNLLDLRALRAAVFECEAFVAEGMRGLLEFPIDELPPQFRVKALQSIQAIEEVSQDMALGIDDILMSLSKSHLHDPDLESIERAKSRAGKFKQLRGMYPGDWRGRDAS